MNLLKFSNQNISKYTKFFFLFLGLGWSLKKIKKVFTKIQWPNNFTFARIISNLPKFISSEWGEARNGCEWVQVHARTNRVILWHWGAVILKRRTALTTQALQLFVDSGTLEYKNADVFDTATRVIFDW